ncbi:hypothetical protein ASG19_17820 [Rhizobium sp. Leaf306]|uniref:hypothetical protein n=1 Tax=Rhizobium sp. Leaf306 TaxID=1736330 RepID=UPI000713AA3E|nr:hypothetical protein [Rhizobium sp. Leaf306]KQQ35545.1 hypothetical protein ASG19_17820 [Rhizobium sp. Leaf306]
MRKAVCICIASVLLCNTAHGSALGNGKELGTPQFLRSDGTVDLNIAENELRALECQLVTSSAMLSQVDAVLEEANSRLDVRLAQIAAFKLKPDPPREPDPVPLLTETGAEKDEKQLEVLRTAKSAFNHVREADDLLQYAEKVPERSRIAAFQNDVQTARAGVLGILASTDEDWQASKRYRDNVARRGAMLDSQFYGDCSGPGFWKVVESSQTTGGETSEFWDGVNRDCEGSGAEDAISYVAYLKRSMLSIADEGSGCKDAKVVADQPDKASVRSTCPWTDDKWNELTQTATTAPDGTVSFQSRYRFPEGSVVSIDMKYAPCDR